MTWACAKPLVAAAMPRSRYLAYVRNPPSKAFGLRWLATKVCLRGAAFALALALGLGLAFAAARRRRADILLADRDVLLLDEVFRTVREAGAARFALRSFVAIGCPFAQKRRRRLSHRLGSSHQRSPPQQQRRDKNDREHHLVHGGPAIARQQRAGRERRDRHGAEHQKVIERLRFVALMRIVAFGDQRGGADESKIPADAEQRQPGPEIPQPKARETDAGRDQDQCQS